MVDVNSLGILMAYEHEKKTKIHIPWEHILEICTWNVLTEHMNSTLHIQAFDYILIQNLF